MVYVLPASRLSLCRGNDHLGRCLISAFDELHSLGHLGEQSLGLISRLLREELRRFPVLTSETSGRSTEFDDLFQEFLVDRFQQITANLLAQASDEESMARLLRRSIRHWLIDQARTTGLGALRRSLERILTEDDSFEKVPPGEPGAGRWRLSGQSGLPYSGRIEDLVEAARSVPNVTVPQWSSARRRPPVADKRSMVEVACAVLKAAAGSMESAQIVQVFAERFPAVLDPAVVPLAESEVHAEVGQVPTPEEQLIVAEEELDAAIEAAQIVGMLSGTEQQIAPHLNDMPTLQRLLGCGRSQAYHHARRLREKLKQLTGESDDGRAVVLEVIRLCGGPPEERT